MTTLVIVESPAKAKTIARFLGKGYIVEASYGHVRDLPSKAEEIPAAYKGKKWARLGVNVEGDFEPIYVIPPDKSKHIQKLKAALKDADQLLLATDEDREGESISWHLLQILKPKVPVKRIVFHEITPKAIQDAIANARDLDEDLVRAQESRRIVDRLYGYELSPVLWKKVKSGLSAGRVQSVAVRLVVEREEARRAFVPSEFWDLEAAFRAATGADFKAGLTKLGGQRVATGKDFDPNTGRLKGGAVVHLLEKDARDLTETVRGNTPWRVAKVEEKPATQKPYAPFTTSTLQQEANRKLGFAAKRTMQIAQHLYEGVDLGTGERIGLITYMRTDSTTLSDFALQEAQNQIRALYGKDYAQGPRQYKTKSRTAQEAHEAIRPTDLGRRPQDVADSLDRDEMRLYELIWKRTIASQMPDAKLLRKTVEIEADGGKRGVATFTATGKTIQFPGFLRAYVEGSDDPNADLGDQETILPDLREGQDIPRQLGAPKDATVLKSVEPKGHTTTPPARYTEASLVKTLEEEGIGRPSTYASIISTIQDRGYIFKQGNALIPTFTAMAVTNLLRDHFGDYVDTQFTARMEEELDEIASGQRGWIDHVRAFYFGQNGHDGAKAGDGSAKGHQGLEQAIGREVERIGLPDVVIGRDPETGDKVSVRIGRYGPYVVRGEGGEGNTGNVPEKVPPADFTVEQALELMSAKAKGPRNLGADPESGQPVYACTGRFGPYVQLGETPDDKKAPKPKRASLTPGMSEETVTLEEALGLLVLPRELGRHPEDKEPVLANIGRYGPYVQHGKNFRSLEAGDDPGTVTFERAMELLSAPKKPRRGTRKGSAGDEAEAAPKASASAGGDASTPPWEDAPGDAAPKTAAPSAAKGVIQDFGKLDDGRKVRVLDGRYGPYVTDGKTNATLPKGTAPEDVTLERALELIEAKAAKGPSKPRGRRK